MGEPIRFSGCNLVLAAPDGREDVEPLYAFRNNYSVVSGRVFLLILGRNMPPAFVGDERNARALAADYGPTWPRLDGVQRTEDPGHG